MKDRTYTELTLFDTFEERFDYLKLPGAIGFSTLGFDRYLSQILYGSFEWKSIRDQIILRDYGCDLGTLGCEIHDRPLVHHINPISKEDLLHHEEWMFDPEYLITTCHRTHNAIHYGNRDLLYKPVVKRAAGDTKLW